jgi:hypothetical protein
MIDVNKITSTLAKLPDQQLQQYAQMHKSDPYIMALAMSESNRRKEMRSAGQGAQGMQEQPKVVDQMVAEMAPQSLPEDQGIGQLPAGDMNFAGGGIIAFADGGDVERYQSGGSIAAKYQQESQEMGMGMRRQYSPDVQAYAQMQAQPSAEEQQMFKAEQQRMLAGGRFNAFPVLPTVDGQAPAAAAAAAAAPTPRVEPTYSPADISGMDRRMAQGSMPSIPSMQSAPKAAPTVDTGRKGSGAGAGVASAAGATKLPSISDLTALRQQISDKQDFKDPAAAGLLELEARERAAAAADKQAIERDAERFKDAYKGREARLAEREADIGKQKESNTGLALLNAGLAIMSTPGGLATAIGKGAQVGTAQFSAGLDKIRSAQERLGDARDRLDDLKLNREESTAKEIRAAENNYRRVSIDAQKRTIDGIRMAADVNEKRATDIYSKTVDMTKTMYEQQQANSRSAAGIAAQLNTPDRILFDQLLKKNDNDAVKALEAFKVAKGDKFDVRSSYADYLKAFAGKEGLTPPMSMGAYAGQFGATLPR